MGRQCRDAVNTTSAVRQCPAPHQQPRCLIDASFGSAQGTTWTNWPVPSGAAESL